MTRALVAFACVAVAIAASCGPPVPEHVEAPLQPNADPRDGAREPDDGPRPPPLGAPKDRGWRGDTLDCDGRLPPHASSSDRIRSHFFGISAPAEPPSRRARNHVRRHTMPSLSDEGMSPSMTRMVDLARFDTSACMEREGRERELGLVLVAIKGGVRTVRALDHDLDDLARCLAETVCDLPVPDFPGEHHVALGLRVSAMSSRRAKVDIQSKTNGEDARVVSMVVAEIATACEQGQTIADGPRSLDLTIAAVPHSTVSPTIGLARVGTSTPPPDPSLASCVETSLDGYRLPLEPSHGVGPITLRVTWPD